MKKKNNFMGEDNDTPLQYDAWNQKQIIAIITQVSCMFITHKPSCLPFCEH